jgi:nucleoid DNA-binding protein
MEFSTKDVVARLVENEKCAKNVAVAAVDATIQAMFDLLKSDDCTKLRIKNIGIFSVSERDGHLGRNPRTGESVEVKPSRGVSFKAARALKLELNDNTFYPD